MNVLVLGWYHHRNAGDDRVQAVMTEWLEGHTLGFLPAGRPLPASYARRWDAVLIGGGGILQQAGGVFRSFAPWVRRTRVPVALVGVSAERAAAELVTEVAAGADRCCFVWVRDQGSLHDLGLVGRPGAFVGPDLTWLRPHGIDERPADDRAGTAVAVASHAGLDPDRWGPALGELADPRPWPFLLEGGADRRVLSRLLPGAVIPCEHTIEPAAGAEVVVSARYHGVVFALQLGRPVVGIGDAPKVRRLLEEQDLGDRWVPADHPERLAEVIAAVRRDLPEAERRSREVRSRLTAEAAVVGADALERLEAAARPLGGRRVWRRLLP